MLKRRIARDGAASVPTTMASNPSTTPMLLTLRCCARLNRARRGGPVTFLLDRVAEDMEDRAAGE